MGRLVALCTVVLLVSSVALAGELADRQDLRIAFDSGDARTLDPHFATTTMDRSIVNPMFNGLVRYPPNNQVGFEPDIAVDWEVSDDGLTWTFYLREGVYFHPFPGYPEGYELTADDVVYSLLRASDSERSGFHAAYRGLEFEKVDTYTVSISLERPMSETLFLAKVANNEGGFVVPKIALEEQGDEWFSTNPVGTGPFKFSSYTPLDSVVMVRNDQYFRGAPILDSVTYVFMPPVASREFGLRTGELDIIEGLKEEIWREQMEALPGVSAPTFGPCEVQQVHFNIGHEPVTDLRVRQAVAYAIDRAAIAAFMGMGQPIYSPALADPAPGALSLETARARGVAYETDRDKTRSLLADAGLPGGFSTEVIISEMASSYLKPMEIIQDQLREVGIDLRLRVVEHATFHALIRDDASPIVYYASWRPDVDVFFTQFYHSRAAVTYGESPITNFSHYGRLDASGDGEVDSIDDLIEQARWELDAEIQEALWKDAQVQLLEHMAAFPVIRLEYTFPMWDYVDLGYPLKWVWTQYSPQITEKTRILAH